jgi:hypothetical protein
MPVPQLPASSDQAYLGASNTLDFNTQYFAGSSATDFLTGTTDTDMNFDWVSSRSVKDTSIIWARIDCWTGTMGQPIPNDIKCGGRFRVINISLTWRLAVAFDQTPSFGSQMLLQLIMIIYTSVNQYGRGKGEQCFTSDPPKAVG